MTTSPPLDGLLVIDMAQFLSGPSAALRLGDLGARVIKVERPGVGDICRTLYLSDTDIDGASTLFHAINRGKQSIALDYKINADRAALVRLATHADVVIQNFRPGVADRLGVGPAVLRAANPRLVVGTISGYGDDGPWADLPGQDLLAQALSGAMWLNGDAGDGPQAVGLSIADMLAGHVLVEGVLAALVRRGIDGTGALVETSLLEALIDYQFEVLTTHLNDGGRLPRRAAVDNAHAYLGAPYGVYRTSDGWLALAMMPLDRLAPLLGLDLSGDPFADRDAIKARIAGRIVQRTTDDWMAVLRAHDIWCAPVLDWPALLASDAFARLGMLQETDVVTTTRPPLRIDGARASNPAGAPAIDQHGAAIRREFNL
ncbi:crotonobetainyl-CoA:carnitine CoA-transferase CaiB-like acyl-CoA transferase [Hephaestia caeni]|uniref:Crotonobetainyl-CoA:carnitine CoA-transferase CaiB-like acyl-CoA transferase n=1 Tax=Hephaestia caeni TaxID=645617 RepID=A0A397P3H6_9SPHN|nr:CaiB/BaiF CoA-transferase family protein [Hephaestia caeni]RIA43792.1 crotonobetainyl-CoA:carnitine CoA-transferase CaiB-like acyl-CoA transferase [Hephaestia caeni]